MTPFIMMNSSEESMGLLASQWCYSHSKDSHKALEESFASLDEGTQFTVLSQIIAMDSEDRHLTEKCLIASGATVARHPKDLIRIVVGIVPLARAITSALPPMYGDESEEEALESARSHCVRSVSRFVKDRLLISDPIWLDTDVVRGRFLIEMVGTAVVPHKSDLKWIGERSKELANHINSLKGFQKIDRELCERVLSTPNPLVTGVL